MANRPAIVQVARAHLLRLLIVAVAVAAVESGECLLSG